jgi:hypothetical protein
MPGQRCSLARLVSLKPEIQQITSTPTDIVRRSYEALVVRKVPAVISVLDTRALVQYVRPFF